MPPLVGDGTTDKEKMEERRRKMTCQMDQQKIEKKKKEKTSLMPQVPEWMMHKVDFATPKIHGQLEFSML